MKQLGKHMFRLGLLLFSAAMTAKAEEGRLIVCYWESWARYRAGDMSYGLDQIPVDKCTHLIYSFAGLDSASWKIKSLEPDFDERQGGFKKLVGLRAKNPKLKVSVAIGGWNEGAKSYSDMVSNSERRKIFIASVVDWMTRYDFDGFDLDWEYPGAADRGGSSADKNNFVLLCKELRAAFDQLSRKRLLTMAVGVAKYRLDDGYDVANLAKYVDFIHLMTYDLRGSWDGFTDNQAPLRKRDFDTGNYEFLNVADSLNLWHSRGAPKSKLVMGVPFYGRSYTLSNPNNNGLRAPTSGGGNPGPYTQQSGYLGYFELCKLIGSYNQKWDSVGKVPYMHSGNQWIGYENTESIKAKVKFAMDNGYAGAMIWAIDLDDYKGTCGQGKNPLVTAMKSAMEGGTTPTDAPVPSPTTITTTTRTTSATTNPTPNPQPTPKPAPDGCTGRKDGDMFRIVPECSIFYMCSRGIAVRKDCPPPLVFDETEQVCNWRTPSNSVGCN